MEMDKLIPQQEIHGHADVQVAPLAMDGMKRHKKTKILAGNEARIKAANFGKCRWNKGATVVSSNPKRILASRRNVGSLISMWELLSRNNLLIIP
jgi:hypothetical protein